MEYTEADEQDGAGAHRDDDGLALDAMRSAVVAIKLGCLDCGYDLRHIAVGSQCPECGRSVRDSVSEAIDPTSSHLPSLADPAAVARGLIWLTICMLAGTTLLSTGAMSLLVWEWRQRASGAWTTFLPMRGTWEDLAVVASGAMGVLAFWSTWALSPSRRAPRAPGAHRDLALISAGLAIWAGLLLCSPLIIHSGGLRWHPEFGLMLAGVLVLTGLRGMLLTIGLRSRQFRTAIGGRQRIPAMLAAVAILALGRLGSLLEAPGPALIGLVIVIITLLLIVVGLAYLVVNACWIRAALLRPPPTLEALVRRPG